ncbi:hypothetical protein K440DRAFT_643903 [Wilcoxina mikolae CBS 423.85]|nr:hypothetical protein K440DRAFT_643903 [Wilcoxina mikolae CBS 423.85]
MPRRYERNLTRIESTLVVVFKYHRRTDHASMASQNPDQRRLRLSQDHLIIENNFEASSRCSQFRCKFLAIPPLPTDVHHRKPTAALWDRNNRTNGHLIIKCSFIFDALSFDCSFLRIPPLPPNLYRYTTTISLRYYGTQTIEGGRKDSIGTDAELSFLYTSSGIWFMPWIESTDFAGTNCSSGTGGGGG